MTHSANTEQVALRKTKEHQVSFSDVDIDIPPGININKLFPTAVAASMVQNGALCKHPCGYYFENMPVDCLADVSMAAIPFRQAEQQGYTKIDFLHLNILSQFQNKEEVRSYSSKQPDWRLLQDKHIVEQLFQLSNSWEFIKAIRPSSVIELADVIAIIRPAKRNLLQSYLINRDQVRPSLYKQDSDDKTSFRRSHAIAYAKVVIMQLNKLEEQIKQSGIIL